ncbi:MAG: ATP-binding protein [Flavobacteriales bacterium]|nr:ATP-binding protein [Flavobacteriales bacterium]
MMTSFSLQRHILPSTIDTLAKVEQIIEDIRSEHSVPEEIYGNILVSISEAVNNAIKHGNKYHPEKEVNFSFDISDKEYIFTVTDQGMGFDFTNTPDPTHPDNIDKLDGRGIFIMKNLSDTIGFEEEGRIVKISFNRV